MVHLLNVKFSIKNKTLKIGQNWMVRWSLDINWCELNVILSTPKNDSGVLLQTNSFKCETFGEPASFDWISNEISKRRHHDQKSCTQTLLLIQFNQCGIFTEQSLTKLVKCDWFGRYLRKSHFRFMCEI